MDRSGRPDRELAAGEIKQHVIAAQDSRRQCDLGAAAGRDTLAIENRLRFLHSRKLDGHASNLQAGGCVDGSLLTVQRWLWFPGEWQFELLGKAFGHPEFGIAVINPGAYPFVFSVGQQ